MKNIALKYYSLRFIAFGIDLNISALFGGGVSLIDYFINIFNFNAIGIITMVFFFCKDLFFLNGSIGKKITGLKIVPSNDQYKFYRFRKFSRNFSLIIYPIEGLFVLFNKGNRLGDIFCFTRVENL